ncbi:jg25829, partial [Pararge aegeria aegeria]
MGYPHIVVCGRGALEAPPRYELFRSGDAEPRALDLNELLATLADQRIRQPVDAGADYGESAG